MCETELNTKSRMIFETTPLFSLLCYIMESQLIPLPSYWDPLLPLSAATVLECNSTPGII